MSHGVIFDCDGVLVDSETLSNGVAAEMLTQSGLPTTMEAAMRDFMGSSTAAVSAEVERRLGHRLPDNFWRDYATRCEERFARELRSVTGIEAALDQITAPTCVASSGSHEKIRFTLGHTGLLARFEGRIFSATEVAHGKPAPDLFLHAADANGLRPVDDGRCRRRAARRAGRRRRRYDSARLRGASPTRKPSSCSGRNGLPRHGRSTRASQRRARPRL